MRAFPAPFLLALLLLLESAGLVRAQAEPLTLSNGRGASITFTESDGTWRWTGLAAPVDPQTWSILDQGSPVTTSRGSDLLVAEWTLVEQQPDKLIFAQAATATEAEFRRVYSFAADADVLRIETWVRSAAEENMLEQVGLLDVRVGGEAFVATGDAPVSFPLFGRSLFVGIEHTSGGCIPTGDMASLWQTPHVKVSGEWQFLAASVVGWAPVPTCNLVAGSGRMRSAFLRYLDTISVKPVNLELNTNTWWTLGPPFTEEDVLWHIEELRKGFTERTGMFFDSYAMDLGWSDPKSVWRADPARFPHEFQTINERLAALGCRLGLWVSPGSFYPEGMDTRWLESEGYEMTPWGLSGYLGRSDKVSCFALGGRYQQAFKASILDYASRYGLGHVKLDFMAQTCNVPSHGHAIGPDSFSAINAGLADVIDGLRAVNPAMALEPLCASAPPSPWWATKTPFVLGPAGTDVPFGQVPCPDWMESLITGRDIAYRAERDLWLLPSQALETFDIVVQCPGNFENLAVMAIGRGRWFVSTYFNPGLMTPERWDFFGALIRWARANRGYLKNALTIGGNPERREAYGYLFHNEGKDIYCLRNPWIEGRAIKLPVCNEASAARDLRMIYPRRETLARLQPGEEGPLLTLAPYETVMLETVPVNDLNPPLAPQLAPEAFVSAPAPEVSMVAASEQEPSGRLHYAWNAEIAVPEIKDAQILILVEGAAAVEQAVCRVTLAGEPAAMTVTGSAGQFSADDREVPENWTWFIVPVTSGNHSLQFSLDVPLQKAAIGVYVSGRTPATSAAADPEEGPAFPVYLPGQRAWSQILLPLTKYDGETAL